MTQLSDFVWAVVGFILSCIVIAAAVVRSIRKRGADSHSTDIRVKITGDARVAVDTLKKFGYSKEESEELVRAALEKAPDSDYEALINMAIKA